ncbi:MAG: T9SS type A sorting domain-containing protein [Chitinophagaceae bacterium]|nr:T9SS type A sorting domain-containing protein [Chitinophagaceae bacterium]
MHIKFLQPNPAKQFGLLSVLANEAGKLVLKILDAEGKFLDTIVTTIDKGYQQIVVEIENWQSGQYIVNAFDGNRFVQAIRVTKP